MVSSMTGGRRPTNPRPRTIAGAPGKAARDLKEPHQPIPTGVDIDPVRAALASLPDRLRDVLMEVYFREHSVAEAAIVLEVSHDAIKSLIFDALLALRERLIGSGLLRGGRDHLAY